MKNKNIILICITIRLVEYFIICKNKEQIESSINLHELIFPGSIYKLKQEQ
jgi:hypothetical protein